ncbi:hypothetical protein N431DRAFT_488274 [Stipitochalara longipes BDJ]|nr:hypothetical protein N431DRAFT_488274 [Stipitochalara longipes BDJ]
MKMFSTLSLFALGTAAFVAAFPRDPTNVQLTSPSSPLIERSVSLVCNDKRDNEISRVENGAASGSAVVAYTAGSGGIAIGVCEALKHYGPGVRGSCTNYAAAVSGAVLIVWQAIHDSRQGTKTMPRSLGTDSFHDRLKAALEVHGLSFDTIEDIPQAPSLVNVENINSTIPSLRMNQQTHISGLRFGNSNSDLLVSSYSDGTGNVIITPIDTSASSNISAPIVRKRHDGPGFKINYRLIKMASYLGNPDLKVALTLSQKIGNDWADRANNENMDEYFGTTSIRDFSTWGFRIISEKLGFGENYESVDVCGTLRSSHDEL